MDTNNTYRVYLRETVYYMVTVDAADKDAAIAQAKCAEAMPKPYEYSPLVATKVDLIRATPHISKKREDMLKRLGFRAKP